MELKPTPLFSRCASLTHARLMSLIKENKCFGRPPCEVVKLECVRVCVSVSACVWEATALVSPFCNLPLLAQWIQLGPECRDGRVQIAADSKQRNI